MHRLRFTGDCDREAFDQAVGEEVWYHGFAFDNGWKVPGQYDIGANVHEYGFPASLAGATVLDVGPASGWFSFYFEQLGASVTALNVPTVDDLDTFGRYSYGPAAADDQRAGRRLVGDPSHELKVMHSLLGSEVELVTARAYDLSPELMGGRKFDLVFMGAVLLHLRDPIGALRAARSVCDGKLIATNWLAEDSGAADTPWAELPQLGEDEPFAWWRPNRAAYALWIEAAGFTGVDVTGSVTMTADVDQRKQHSGEAENPTQTLVLGKAYAPGAFAHPEAALPALRGSVPSPPPGLVDHAGNLSQLADAFESASSTPPDFSEVVSWWVPGDPLATDDRVGKAQRESILAALPSRWSLEGKRVLDFGCGHGRTLRHFLPEAEVAEVWGCDIHRPSIEWLERHLSPPLKVFVSGEQPPLPHPSESFDLIWASSVFTHLTDSWAPWLLELRRLLRPDGLLVVTIANEGWSFALDNAPWHDAWDEDQVGMHVVGAGNSWDQGGPGVYHGRWWIRAHWGRAFDIVSLEPGGFGFATSAYGQGVAVMRPNHDELSPSDLEAPEPGEPRELAATRYSLRQSLRETAGLHAQATRLRRPQGSLAGERDELACRQAQLSEELAVLDAELSRTAEEIEVIRSSRSWQLARPARAAAQRLRTLDPRR